MDDIKAFVDLFEKAIKEGLIQFKTDSENTWFTIEINNSKRLTVNTYYVEK